MGQERWGRSQLLERPAFRLNRHARMGAALGIGGEQEADRLGGAPTGHAGQDLLKDLGAGPGHEHRQGGAVEQGQ